MLAMKKHVQIKHLAVVMLMLRNHTNSEMQFVVRLTAANATSNLVSHTHQPQIIPVLLMVWNGTALVPT